MFTEFASLLWRNGNLNQRYSLFWNSRKKGIFYSLLINKIVHVIAVAAKHLFQNCLAGWYPIALETQNNTSAVLHDNIN